MYQILREAPVRMIKTFTILMLGMILSACSDGMRIKNLVNYPTVLSSLVALDTLKVLPDVIKYMGSEEASFVSFDRDILIQGRQDQRPIWTGDAQGCLRVESDATIHILDFNFRGRQAGPSLIQVDSGRLILENCDLTEAGAWSIEVGPEGELDLRNVRFSKLAMGAIKINGGTVKAYNCTFDQTGKNAIFASNGKSIELHKVNVINTMGTAIELNSISEVWLDSLMVMDSFEDGISLTDCDFVLFNQVESNGNGRNGLYLNGAVISGLLNYSALGNLVHGMVAINIDTLRVLNSEFVGNGESGASLLGINRGRIAGIKVGHNGHSGFHITRGQDLLIHHSTFQASPGVSLFVDSVKTIRIEHASIINNKNGLHILNSDSVEFNNNLLASNKGVAAQFVNTTQLDLSVNLVKENQVGIRVEDVLNVQLDSNQIVSNEKGTDIRSVARIKMTGNMWARNQSGSYFSGMGDIISLEDQWQSNSISAFEVLSGNEIFLTNARFSDNQTGGLLNQVVAKIESCNFDSGNGVALKVMNGALYVTNSKFHMNKVGIELGEGSQGSVVQSIFTGNTLAIDSKASASLMLSYSQVKDARAAIRIGNYGKAEIFSNQFNTIDDYCIQVSGPHLQSLVLRQNILSRTGGVLSSEAKSGVVSVSNNTFAINNAGFDVDNKTIGEMNHNIFHKTPFDFHILKDPDKLVQNCFDAAEIENYPVEVRLLNIYSAPKFVADYHLSPQSPCLGGGENGLTIGARGVVTENRPVLEP